MDALRRRRWGGRWHDERGSDLRADLRPQAFPATAGYRLPACDVPEAADRRSLLPAGAMPRAAPPALPEVTEPEVVRHYIRLSTLNHHVDKAIYPLGSCTMKYNPKINEDLARSVRALRGSTRWRPRTLVQGLLGILHRFSRELAEVVGMDAVSLHPAAGAQGELLGIRLVRGLPRAARGTRRRRSSSPTRRTAPIRRRRAWSATRWCELKSRPDGRLDLDAPARDGQRRDRRRSW